MAKNLSTNMLCLVVFLLVQSKAEIVVTAIEDPSPSPAPTSHPDATPAAPATPTAPATPVAPTTPQAPATPAASTTPPPPAAPATPEAPATPVTPNPTDGSTEGSLKPEGIDLSNDSFTHK
ncbi:hypothetical protein TSUD_23800 [Trifolium subterraneum]|uniref:Uncharacterized protein n=1 Tax=Trifolium subterraneum TaxID=3900 RepID=A0A2Z6M2E8_TRISU|nr:hypothetical protein TSUD_23800 [Trifolium subterraneum]